MNKSLALLLTAGLLTAGTLTTRHLFAQDPGQEAAPDMSPEEMQAMMMEMMKAAAPGEEHAEMMSWAGNWRAEMKMRMGGPDSPWESHSGTAKMQKALGGRYLIEKFEADMGPMFGKMEGLLIFGYNNLSKQYEATWYDTMSTWGMSSTGFRNEEGMYEMSGLVKDVITPEGRPMRYVTGPIDEDHLVMHMYDTIPPHGMVEVMQIDYYRIKE